MSAAVYRVARRSSPFTQIDRKTLQDNSLTFEARGLLAYLLSKPDDWEVRPGVVANDGGIGRDKLQRIVSELIEARYMRRERVRDPETGVWLNSRTMVYERPQPGKVEAADESSDPEGEDDDTASFDTSNDAPAANCAIYAETPVASLPQPENPHVAQPHVENTVVDRHKKEYTNNSPLSPPLPAPATLADVSPDPFWTERVAADWRRFEDAWPFDPAEDRERARRAFGRMGDGDRTAAVAHIGDHVRWSQREGRRKGSARSYIGERKFEDWAKGLLTHPGDPVFVRAGTPAFEAWEARWRFENNRPPSAKLFTIERRIDGVLTRGTLRPTLFPPKRERPESSADPPAEHVPFD
jgi:hypothetical protein